MIKFLRIFFLSFVLSTTASATDHLHMVLSDFTNLWTSSAHGTSIFFTAACITNAAKAVTNDGDLAQFTGLAGDKGDYVINNGDGTASWESPLNSYNAGIWADYLNNMTVTVSTGEIMCNGNHYTVGTAFNSYVDTLAAGQDLHYLYLDDSASTQDVGSIVTYWATNNPVKNTTLHGSYHPVNTADRVVTGVNSPAASATIFPFNMLNNFHSWTGRVQLASNVNPNDAWQTPDDSESSVYLPANASHARFVFNFQDAAADCIAAITSKEEADTGQGNYEGQSYWFAYNRFRFSQTIHLGASKNVRISGANLDDNFLNLWMTGWIMER